MTWLDTPAHARWLEAECDRLLAFGRASRLPDGGFAWLDDTGFLYSVVDLLADAIVCVSRGVEAQAVTFSSSGSYQRVTTAPE